MIHGPASFVPAIEVKIERRQQSHPLAEQEGIYVRDLKTGQVKLVTGPQTYNLGENEVLWKKELSKECEQLLGFAAMGRGFAAPKVNDKGEYSYDYGAKKPLKREKTQAVKIKAPHNSACQIFDFMDKKSRIVFGPELIMLKPYEEISLIKLSGGMPKVENAI